ncbi:MAG: ATP-binding protein [Lachnospiraceae bacterium]|nr:ATP-binding protein [Lachnospiraceae bacterium]
MAKVILICGKICSGKSTYAERLRIENKAVLLSIDEIMLVMFGLYVGDKHDEYVEKTEKYLFDKSVEIIETGIDVILDWGLWTRDERRYAKEFYSARGIENEIHYLNISNETWKTRLDKRNRAVSAGEIIAYPVDDNLAAKFGAIFEMPDRDEIDVWVEG